MVDWEGSTAGGAKGSFPVGETPKIPGLVRA